MPAKFTLTHKLGLMILVPLAVNWFFYNQTQTKIHQLEKLVDDLANRRALAGTANNLITNEFFALQALMQYKMFQDKNERKNFDLFMAQMQGNVQFLETLLGKKLNDPATASKIHFRNAELLDALKYSDFHPDAENQFGSFFEDLERNQRVKTAMLSFIDTLREIDNKAKSAVDESIAAEAKSRTELRQGYDLLVLINSLMSIAIAIFISKLIVSPVKKIEENFSRASEHKPLLDPIKSADEMEDLDRNFREMIEKLDAGSRAQLEMMQQIASSRDRLQTVIDTLPAALFITDSEGKVETLNKFAKDFFNINRNYFHENTIAKLFQLNADMHTDFLAMLERETKHSPMDLFALTAEKELVPVKVSTVAFDSMDETKFLTVVADETEAFKLKQAKSDFFSMVSHDMRTPLATISSVLQMALRGAHGEISDEASNRLNTALRSTSVLLDLVNRLLKIEKIDSAEIEISPEKLDIADVASDVAAMITPQLEGKNISIANNVESQTVYADREYIQEVVMNLVSNAVKFSPEGGRISLTNHVEDSKVVVEIADQGPGVPLSKRDAIFERFTQADKRRDSKTGFGLGLAICKAIVLQHGGSIGVREAEGGGSVFWFSLQSKNGSQN